MLITRTSYVPKCDIKSPIDEQRFILINGFSNLFSNLECVSCHGASADSLGWLCSPVTLRRKAAMTITDRLLRSRVETGGRPKRGSTIDDHACTRPSLYSISSWRFDGCGERGLVCPGAKKARTACGCGPTRGTAARHGAPCAAASHGASGTAARDGASGAASCDGASGAASCDGASGAASRDGASGAASCDGASGAAGRRTAGPGHTARCSPTTRPWSDSAAAAAGRSAASAAANRRTAKPEPTARCKRAPTATGAHRTARATA